MFKKFSVIFFTLLCFTAFAQNSSISGEPESVTVSEDDSASAKKKWGFKFKDENPNPHEIGVYFKDYFPVARMSNHSYNFAGGGVSYAYHSPFTFVLPEFMPSIFGQYWNVGFSSHLDFAGVSKNDDYVDSWWVTNLFGGAFFEVVFNDWFEFQPSVEYGFQIDVVKSSRKANGAYFSQSMLLSPTAKFKPIYTLKDNLSFDVTPFWEMSFESDGVANYLGVRLGVMYRIGGTVPERAANTEVKVVEKVVEKEVIREVIKEVPVYIEKTPEPEPDPDPVVEEEPQVEETPVEEAPAEVIEEEPQVEETPVEEAPAEVVEEEPQVEETPVEEAPAEVVEEEPKVEETPVAAPVEVVEEAHVEVNEDGTLKVQLPVFSFISDQAVLTDDPKNEEIIRQLLEILKDSKYDSFKCDIIGYVNPDNDVWSEHEYELATARATTILNRLVEAGIDSERLTASHGEGKTDNKVYNRRVEVKLYR